MYLNTVEQNPVLINGRLDHISCDLIQRSNECDSLFPINYINELMENYRELRSKNCYAGPIWGGITDGAESILEAWYSLGAESMHSKLSNMFCTPLTHGFDQGHIVSDAINHSDASKKHVLSITVDKLLLLAQSLGVAPVYNPEQGDWKFDGDFDAILSQIQARVGFDITAPSFYGGAWGIGTSFGIHSERTLMAIFIANEVSKNFSLDHSICEIGGGSGVLAFYLHKAGFKKISIVDLPEVGFVQSYFLRRNFTDAKIYLDKDFHANQVREGFVIYSPDRFFQTKKWDLVLNIDSLPEMPKSIAENYVARIFSVGASFFSVNQEAGAAHSAGIQNNVHQMCLPYNGSRSLLRAPFWMRKGYVEEIYRKKSFLNLNIGFLN